MIATVRAKELAIKTRRVLGLASDPRQPSRALFRGIRRRLTVWYSGLLAAVLILCGVILYLAVQQSLLGTMDSQLQSFASLSAADWQTRAASPFPLSSSCPQRGADINLLIACYGPDHQLAGVNFPGQLSAFLKPALARSVAAGGTAADTITTGQNGEFNTIRRYAVWVPVSVGSHSPLGVLVVGLPVGGQFNTLSALLNLLLLLGGLTILLSLGAGLFLANRALQPARIAYARQRDFIADASHELRTPLTMLRSSVEFVLRGKDHLPADDVALLEDTVQETTHLTSLANNMLNLARLDSDDVHVDEEVIDLSDLAAEVTRWAQPLANERQISLSVEAAEPALVLGDRPLLEQALLVLVDNAIKYNRPDGSVEVGVASDNATALVSVADTGIGVAPEDLKRMGERFYRVDKARSRESGGAGLGLSIVRSIVSRHGGELRLQSEPGTGTKATISLPVVGSLNGR